MIESKNEGFEEWMCSNPDFEVYIPECSKSNVVPTPEGTFLAFWTQSSYENAPDQRLVVSRSSDKGLTWSEPLEIDGPTSDDPPGTGLASWEFSIVAPRILPHGRTRIY